ncbi:tryptamine 5-hydroxylase-like [Diospyros lotus]|uniref:tryptamine 5-hydroxylase-like n=1 Tax=Diospyros lotus TaxID=55363 RepID=UPI0022550BCB|nr:tryptamine 5-hydroxylase-like [Diospyros lotus]
MDGFTLHVLLLLLLQLSATFGFYVLSRRPTRRTAALPPSPPGLPIIGHLHLLSDKPHCSMAELARKLGPIIYLQLGRVDTVVISSAQLAELVLKTHDHVFANRPQLVAAQYLSFGCSDVTFSPYGPYWRQARKICVTELLSSKRVNSFELVRDEEVTRLVSAVSDRTGSEVNMSELFFKLANDMLCRVAFGKRFMEQTGDLAAVLTETQALLAGFCWGDFFPGWAWVNWASGMKRRLEKNLEELRTVGDDIIREHLKKRERAGPTGDEKEDFVDVLLRVQRRDDLEVPITDDKLKALVLDMFVAGTDTTSSTLEWTMTQLARHPTILKKAQEEVRKTAAAAGTRTVEEADLRHLCYLKAVIKETMRLNPPVPLLVPRESMENCNLGGYEVVAGTRVLINTYAMGRDPGSWENPLEFRPERFDGADFRGQDFRFLPFGGGRRGCPGFGFGMATVEMALARILYHFDWELGPGVEEAKDLDMEEIFGLATRKKSALVLVPKRIH